MPGTLIYVQLRTRNAGKNWDVNVICGELSGLPKSYVEYLLSYLRSVPQQIDEDLTKLQKRN